MAVEASAISRTEVNHAIFSVAKSGVVLPLLTVAVSTICCHVVRYMVGKLLLKYIGHWGVSMPERVMSSTQSETKSRKSELPSHVERSLFWRRARDCELALASFWRVWFWAVRAASAVRTLAWDRPPEPLERAGRPGALELIEPLGMVELLELLDLLELLELLDLLELLELLEA